jgi:hypothetical protein
MFVAATERDLAAADAPARAAAAQLEAVPDAHPLRNSFEQFIAARFDRAYGARVGHFLPYLLGVRDVSSRWQAGAGYGPAGLGRLFLEQYLDAPVEQVLAAAAGRAVERTGIVEVGNLAADSAGMARVLIPLLARHLHKLGYRWVVFTATRELRNSFRRLGLAPLQLARAEPSRVHEAGATWGSYYQHDPRVMAGKIALGLRVRAKT